MDTGERTSDDSKTAKETGLKSGVLTRGTFTVVVVTNNDPLDAAVTVVSSSSRDASVFAGNLVLDLVSFTVFNVDRTNKTVL